MIGYRLCWAQSASIKATDNGEMSVACPATRRDGRRQLRLRKRKELKITLKVRYLKPQTWNLSLQTSKCESENLQNWVFKLQTWNCESEKLQSWNFKVRKWKSSNLSFQTWNCESEKVQTWNFKVRKWKSSNLSLQTWNLTLRKWKSSKLRAESFQLLSFDKLQVLKPEN